VNPKHQHTDSQSHIPKPQLPSLKMAGMAAPPVSLLGRHRILSPTAGVRVSPLCLGAMNFGTAWSGMLGECTKETCFEMLDYFYSQGGNFIDTAVNYQDNESETWLGEWMEKRGNRDEMVIATKFTGSQLGHLGTKVQQSNYGGNSAKNVFTSVERSLKQLKTSYIDLVSWTQLGCFSGRVEGLTRFPVLSSPLGLDYIDPRDHAHTRRLS
jgi:hypothetical protein